MPDRVVRYILAGDSSGAVRAMEATEVSSSKTARSLDRTGKTAEVTGKRFGVMGKVMSAVKWGAAAAGIGGLIFGVRDAIKAGQEWQQQQAQLQAALKATGQGADSLERLNKAIETTSTRGGFTPQEEAAGMARLVRITSSATKATKLNRVAIMLARGAHLGYAQAVQMVAQVQTGQVGRLQKYFGVIQPVTKAMHAVGLLTAAQKKANPELIKQAKLQDKMATAQKANALITSRYAGATQAYNRTAAGSISNLNHIFDQLSERLGKLFLPIVTRVAMALSSAAQYVLDHWKQIGAAIKTYAGPVVAILRNIVVWVTKQRDLLKAIAVGVGVAATAFAAYKVVLLATAAAQAAIAAVSFVVTFIRAAQAVGVMTAAMTALDISMTANPIGLIVVAIAALVAGVVYAYMHFKTFRVIVNSVFNWLRGAVTVVVGFVRKHWRLLATIILFPFIGPLALVATHFNQFKRLVGRIVGWIGDRFDWLAKKIKAVLALPGKALALPGKVAGKVGGFLHHPFGLHSGGIVPRYAMGGMTGIVPGAGNRDTYPAWLTPGEGVLRKEAMAALGSANFNRINAGAGVGPESIDLNVTAPVYLDGRKISENTTHYALKLAARK